MTTFSFPAQLLPRLSRLVLATDCSNTVLDHLALRITPTALRLSATDGKMLASMVHGLTDVQGEPADVILDRAQIIAACKLLSKAGGRIAVNIGTTEARFTSGSVSAIVRLRDGTYPNFEHMWQRTEGQRWLPCAASLAPTYISKAQAIVGKSEVCFRSPVPANSDALRIWKAEPGQLLSPADIAAWANSPAYWSDSVVAILIMPISRSDEGHQLDLRPFICPQVSDVALAA